VVEEMAEQPEWFPEPEEEWEYRITYFPLYAKGECVKTALACAGVKWIDNVMPFDDWANWKSKMPNGYMPVMEVNG